MLDYDLFLFNSLTIFKFSELGALFIIFSRIFSRFATCVQSVNKFYHGKSSLQQFKNNRCLLNKIKKYTLVMK